MRIEFKKLMEKLGVNRDLSPYETHPWFYCDDEKGISCSAEVRMGPGGTDIEAEIQFLSDSEEKEEEDDDDEESEDGEESPLNNGIKQIMRLHIEPTIDGKWETKSLLIKGEDYSNKVHNWEEKGCNFFKGCIESIQMSILPDIDELIEKYLNDDDNFGGRSSGRVGRKSPKIKPGALLGMKKPGG
ncbi:MAG: hypothetical protein KAJ86_00860 [Alphaproteobacteria bacterium]|nr:hypothetical protein [Alphaproteobacteria bacterium]